MSSLGLGMLNLLHTPTIPCERNHPTRNANRASVRKHQRAPGLPRQVGGGRRKELRGKLRPGDKDHVSFSKEEGFLLQATRHLRSSTLAG